MQINIHHPHTMRRIAALALVLCCLLGISTAARVAVILWRLTGCGWRVDGEATWRRFTRTDLATLRFS